MRSFASDNYAPAHPDVLQSMVAVNQDHDRAYGADAVTQKLEIKIKEVFGKAAQIFPVWNGTGANVVALQAMLRPWEAVICTSQAHINVDEGGAPERIIGTKLIDLPTPNAKLTPAQVNQAFIRDGDEHYAQPRVVSITQSTEYGTVYSVSEIAELAEVTHKHNAFLHLDGARISNAAVALNVPFAEFTTKCGVDVISFGGTKNGLISGEAVIFLNSKLTDNIKHIRKTLMQLNSKMRYSSAQLLAFLENDLWKRNALNANKMAQLLATEVAQVPGIKITQTVEVNSVFAIVPQSVITRVIPQFPFYVWDERTNEVRWMCSWDTTQEDVMAFVAAIKAAVNQPN
jgi:threonine aldolase